MSIFNSPGRLTPVGVVEIPRPPLFEFTPFHVAVLLALMFHFAGLYTYAIMFSPKNTGFFSENEPKAKEETEVALVKIEPPKPAAVTPPPTNTPQPAAKTTPRVTIPTNKPVEVAKGTRTGGATQHAPVKSRVTDVAPPVVASAHGTGPAVASNNGHGAVGGDPNAHGTGDGTSARQGDPNGSATGASNGGGAPANPGEGTTSAPDYSNWEHMPSEVRPPAPPGNDITVRAAGARDWQSLAQIWGIDYAKLSALAHVDPYCLGQQNPQLSESDRLNGRSGLVAVVVDIDENGKPTPQVQPSGDALMDRIAYNIAKDTRWLPGLAYGRPTACRVQYNLSFSGFGHQ